VGFYCPVRRSVLTYCPILRFAFTYDVLDGVGHVDCERLDQTILQTEEIIRFSDKRSTACYCHVTIEKLSTLRSEGESTVNIANKCEGQRLFAKTPSWIGTHPFSNNTV